MAGADHDKSVSVRCGPCSHFKCNGAACTGAVVYDDLFAERLRHTGCDQARGNIKAATRYERNDESQWSCEEVLCASVASEGRNCPDSRDG